MPRERKSRVEFHIALRRSEDDEEKAIDEMKKLVKMHDNLLEVSGKIEEVFTGILFIDLFGIIGMMCSLAFLAFAGIGWLFFTKYFMMFLAASWNAFNHCYYGNRLSDASVEVADDVYGSSWFNGKLKYRKLTVFVMLRAQNKVQLTGLSFLNANLETFHWVKKQN
ncbi:unnamed protein product [Chironomus riparius]|uniref:Odorant receptor n=1 Tax=Chironomus riparius TaxID=315576 RepID=A0A9N9S1L0_9DIPT|nr:unnamed protein product [Chironomus riparius]